MGDFRRARSIGDRPFLKSRRFGLVYYLFLHILSNCMREREGLGGNTKDLWKLSIWLLRGLCQYVDCILGFQVKINWNVSLKYRMQVLMVDARLATQSKSVSDLDRYIGWLSMPLYTRLSSMSILEQRFQSFLLLQVFDHCTVYQIEDYYMRYTQI